MLELTLEEAKELLRKLEYTYKKKGSALINKIKEFIAEKDINK